MGFGEHMEHQGNQNADDPRHGDDQDQQQLGIGRSLRPGTATVPVVLMADTDLPDGSSAYLSLGDVVQLRRELAAVFGRSDSTLSRGQGEAL